MPVSSLLLLALSFGAQDSGQIPMPPTRDRDGLLPVSETYFGLAAASGGDFYFWAPGEFATASLSIPQQDDPMLLAYGRLDHGGRSFELPVESDARALVVFVGAQRKDRVALRRPDGSVLRFGDPGVTLQSFLHMEIASIDSPEPGAWRLQLAGLGRYVVSAHIKPANERESVDFSRFEFVEMGGRPGHEGWFPIRREPRRGERLSCSARVSGSVADLAFAYVSIDDRHLGALRLDEGGGSGDYFGTCEVPEQTFRVVVSGLDRYGMPFRRTRSGLVQPE